MTFPVADAPGLLRDFNTDLVPRAEGPQVYSPGPSEAAPWVGNKRALSPVRAVLILTNLNDQLDQK